MKVLSFLLLGVFLMTSGAVFSQEKAPSKFSTFITKTFKGKTAEEKAARAEKRAVKKEKRSAKIDKVKSDIGAFFSKTFKGKTAEEKAARAEKRAAKKEKRSAKMDKVKTDIGAFFSKTFKGKTAEEKAAKEARRASRRKTRGIKAAAKKEEVIKRRRRKCSIAKTMTPKCWQKRERAEMNVALIYYGDDSMKIEDLDRIEPLLIERFSKATDNSLALNIVVKRVLPFKTKMPNDYTYKDITDPKRLQRIWYIENVNGKVIQEIYEEYKKIEDIETVHQLDAVLAITAAQFNGLGFASGRMSVTEYPSEVGYGLQNGGEVEYPSDFVIVDELIHELGHNVFLGHTSTPCLASKVMKRLGVTKLTEEVLDEVNRCCDSSPSKNDVMSYCRNRANVSEDFMHGFESCNLDMIQNKIIPSMLKGGVWNVPNRTRCL
jgi:hypothetical protein